MALSENDILSKGSTISVNQIYADTRRMLITEQQPAQQVLDTLMAQGLSEDTGILVIKEIIEESIKEAEASQNSQAKRDMLFGALWCVGGLVATLANFGLVFWGAIIFGGIQFFRGAANLNRSD